MEMKCNGCEREVARVFCCADEAALCFGCDEKIHSANGLVSKHQRVSLFSDPSPSKPKCDICQETVGYLFCLDDRALLCRKCDVAIHTVNSFVSGHQRFLFTGTKVGLEPPELGESRIAVKSTCAAAAPRQAANTDVVAGGIYDFSNLTACDSNGAVTSSHTEVFLDLVDSNSNNPFCQDALSKEPGSSEWWKILRSTEEELLNGEWTTDDASWTVPELFRQYSQRGFVLSTDTGRSSSNNMTSNAPEAGYSGAAPEAAGSLMDDPSVSTKRRRRK